MRYVKSPRIAYRTIQGEAFIVTPWDNQIHLLNETGSRLWDWLEQEGDPGRLASLLSEEYAVSPDEAARDVEEFLREMARKGIVI